MLSFTESGFNVPMVQSNHPLQSSPHALVDSDLTAMLPPSQSMQAQPSPQTIMESLPILQSSHSMEVQSNPQDLVRKSASAAN